MKTWKIAEKKIAELFGGQRVGVTGLNTEDVEHDTFSIEVKHRKSIPAWLKNMHSQAETNSAKDKIPIVVLHETGMKYSDSFVILTVKDFLKVTG